MSLDEPFTTTSGEPRDIAIIGMSCRFPGARSKEAFWNNLLSGNDSITHLTSDEVAVDESILNDPNYVLACGALDGYDEFDPAFFGITERSAAKMTPEHRIFLQSAWEAVEDGGYDPSRVDGEVGIYAACNPQTAALYSSPPDWVSAGPEVMERTYGWVPDTLTSNALYHLGLTGEALTLSATCTGFHFAVHLACQSLLLGQTDIAIAGGVIVRLPHKRGYLHQRGAPLSRDGICRPFDTLGSGTVLSSGVATLLLKPLDLAIVDRDNIYAVIKGSAVNNNGRTAMAYGVAQPERLGACIATAMHVGNVTPDTVTAYEANGLGLPLADALEVSAAQLAFGSAPPALCAIGSVKGNIGHAGLVAGGSSTIKAVFSLLHRQLVPTINLTEPHPDINFAETPFRPQIEVSPWEPDCGIRRMGVTAIGAGGYNAHLVLEEPPDLPERPPADTRPRTATLSARNESALARQRIALREWLTKYPEQRIDDICFTLNTGRKELPVRWATTVSSTEDLLVALEETATQRPLHDITHAWANGQEADLTVLHRGEACRRVPLPTYPFEQRRIWRENW
ncbi:beta-ketoacyl synthase N-terminal-like domain-containing protein [Streptomyces sp. SudanB66_2053]|uniref:beta-ketoacyl synthase N-terminal-like domain-containing protein n=1 Tax=Streptomyces sp. SudanB66_2053 TaxID=3035277 RepID=UPI003F578C71